MDLLCACVPFLTLVGLFLFTINIFAAKLNGVEDSIEDEDVSF